jgi:phosphopantothenoylcysteine synthetase/decarboxylase
MYYTKSSKDSCEEFANAAFGNTLPMPAMSQKQTFSDILAEEVDKQCSLEVVEAFREELCERVEEHKLSKERDTLVLNSSEVSDILLSCGVDKQTANSVKTRYEETFGQNAELIPQNLIELKKISLENDDISIKISPQRSDLITTKTVDGVSYLMIKVEGNVLVNGVPVHIGENENDNHQN